MTADIAISPLLPWPVLAALGGVGLALLVLSAARRGRGTVLRALALGVLVVALVVAGTTWFSGASFTSSSFTWATVGAAADYHPPTVAVTSPGATVSGTLNMATAFTQVILLLAKRQHL